MRRLWIKGAAGVALLSMSAGAALAQSADLADNSATTGRIGAGQTITGALEAPSDHDWYQISLRGGQAYRFTLHSADGDGALSDPVLALHNASGEVVAENDDTNDLNSRIDFTPPADGIYYLDAGGFADAQGGYVLAAAEYVQPTDNVPATTASTARLTLGTPLNGSVDFDGDADWYRVTLQPGFLYHITLNSAAANGIPDPMLRVLSATGEELAVNDDADGLNSAIDFTANARGTYFIEARNLYESGEGGYVLTAERRALPTDAISATATTTGGIAPGGEVSGTLDFPRDADWYRITLQGGQTYRFALDSVEGEHAFDPLLRLLSSTGGELARDDDGGPGLNSAIEYTPSTTGVYYLEARGFSDEAVGSYVLRARLGDIPADATTDLSLSSEGDYVEGVLAPSGDKDWYAFDVAEGGTVRLALSNGGAQPVGDPLLIVYDSHGQEVARDDDGGGNLNSYLEFTPATGGRYYAEARGFSDEAQGNYVLQLTPGEIGGEASTADTIDPTTGPRQSRIAPANDSDWFTLNAIEGRAYRVFLDAAPGDEVLDPYLKVIAADGTTALFEDDDGGTGINSYISFIAPQSGPLFLAVSSYEGQSSGGYALRVVDTEVPGQPGTDEMLQADEDSRASRIDMPGDKDFYLVEFQEGASYEITVTGSGADPLRDPILTVLNANYAEESEGEDGATPNLQTLATDDNSGPGRNARLVYTPTSAGNAFLQVTAKGLLTGDYTIAVRRLQGE